MYSATSPRGAANGGQVSPPKPAEVTRDDIDDLQVQIDNKANASTVGGISTRLNAVEADIADHETRIAALE
jgi:hypothetical protein